MVFTSQDDRRVAEIAKQNLEIQRLNSENVKLKKALRAQREEYVNLTSIIFQVVQTNQKNYTELLRGIRVKQDAKRTTPGLLVGRGTGPTPKNNADDNNTDSPGEPQTIKVEPKFEAADGETSSSELSSGFGVRARLARKAAPKNLSEKSLRTKMRRDD